MGYPGASRDPYYRRDLALVHHLGFGFHADLGARGILELLKPVRTRDGLVVELGCGSGLLTKHLLDPGHRVVATDASPAMLDLAALLARHNVEAQVLSSFGGEKLPVGLHTVIGRRRP